MGLSCYSTGRGSIEHHNAKRGLRCRPRRPTMAYVGIDVHKKQSQICTFTEASEILHQHLHTHWGRFVAFLPSAKACILIEASTESAWVARSDRGRPALTYLPDTPVAARAPGLVVDRRIGN